LSYDPREFDADLSPLAFLPGYVRPRIQRVFSDEARNYLRQEFIAAFENWLGASVRKVVQSYLIETQEQRDRHVADMAASRVVAELEARGIIPSARPAARPPVRPEEERPSRRVTETPSEAASEEVEAEEAAPAGRALTRDEVRIGSPEAEEVEQEGRPPHVGEEAGAESKEKFPVLRKET